jgi:GxxExxY protein
MLEMTTTYEQCLCFELSERELQVDRQLELPIHYKGKRLDAGYRIDLLVNQQIIVELKSVQKLGTRCKQRL